MTVLFLTLQLFHPLCRLSAWALGLEFHLYNESLYLILTAVLSFLLWKKSQTSLWNLALFPLTVLACAWEILLLRSLLAVPSTAIRCSFAYAMIAPLPDKWYTYLSKGLFTLLTIGLAALCGFDLIFGSIGSETVVQEIPSPSGAYTAQLIDDDQGALGGSTKVQITQPNLIPLGIGALRPKTQTLYTGPWGEFESMTLAWQDENTLLISETPYPIN